MNTYSQKALLYFPTTVLFIDDNPMFLSTIGLNIDKNIPVSLCDKPQKALELLRATPNVDNLIQRVITHLSSDADAVNTSFMSKSLNLYQEIYNQQRFALISTIVVDYSMPYMDGATLCKEIEHLPIKKIMLTAEADYSKAVELFNEGIIDYFIIKDSSNMPSELNKAIEKAQLSYFEEASTPLFDYLSRIILILTLLMLTQ